MAITKAGNNPNPNAPSTTEPGYKNRQMGSLAKFQINQALEKRAGIKFNYAPTNGVPAGRIRWLPFFENPTIVESRKANYANTKVFLRNEPVRLYTGSEARKFKVDIHYSLIHMAAMVATHQLFNMFNDKGTEMTNAEILTVRTYLTDVLKRDTDSRPDTTIEEALKNMRDRTSLDGPVGPLPLGDDQSGAWWNYALLYVMKTTPSWLRHAELIQYVMNTVRNSVISTAQMPVKGPPICQLKWGSTYDFTPCIITDYRIQPVENAGYDTKSLTSQRLKISLSLEEMRNINGNLWGNPDIGGDLPGWDTVLDLGSMDPPFETDQFRSAEKLGNALQALPGMFGRGGQ